MFSPVLTISPPTASSSTHPSAAVIQQQLMFVQLMGVPSNKDYCGCVMADPRFAAGETTTGFLRDMAFYPHGIEVVAPGINTTVQVKPATACPARYRFLSVTPINRLCFTGNSQAVCEALRQNVSKVETQNWNAGVLFGPNPAVGMLPSV